MEVFIARQPIFDKNESVYAYELLFRSGMEEVFSHPDPDQASARVMADGSFLMGMAAISGGKPVFINATRDILKWLSFIALAGMGEDKPDELVIAALIRARFCEALAPRVGLNGRAEELFLLGMFSLLDAMMDRPLPGLLTDMPIADEIKAALLGEENRLRDVFEYALAYERGDWEKLSEKAGTLGLADDGIPQLYMDTVEWAHKSFEEIRPGP